jgi:hypothetical protein
MKITFFIWHLNGIHTTCSSQTYSAALVAKVSFHYIVTCIARQQTDKHLMTEYTHATTELQMLLLVAKQQSERQAASKATIT